MSGVYTITVAWRDLIVASCNVAIKGSDGNNTGNLNSGNSSSSSNVTGNTAISGGEADGGHNPVMNGQGQNVKLWS